MDDVARSWNDKFIVDVFVIDAEEGRNCTNYPKALYKERELVAGDSFNLFNF